MDETRFKKLELTVYHHNRRLDDHDKLHSESRKDIEMLQNILHETQKQTGVLLEVAPHIKALSQYAEKTYDVFEPLARISAKFAKFAIMFTAIWHGAKWAYAKIVLVWP